MADLIAKVWQMLLPTLIVFIGCCYCQGFVADVIATFDG